MKRAFLWGLGGSRDDGEGKMRVRLISAAAAAAVLGFASAASAQTTTGTVNVIGTVADKCTVSGGASATTFSDTFNALELADTDGTLRTIAPFTTAGEGFQVHCTTIPDVSITATPMTNLASAPSGYANTVNYVAYADFNVVVGGDNTISTPTGGSSGPTPLTAHLENVSDNVVIRADTFTTPGANDILVAGAYAGLITVTITP
jgi:hypothetical protein